MEYLVFFGVIGLAFIGFMIKGVYDNINYKKHYAEKLRRDYGKFPNKEYKAERYENIPNYFLRHKTDYFIDDITWNDLEMDTIFQLMNHSHSASGEEYLYHTLRCPQLDLEQLKKMDSQIEYFRKEEDVRVKLQTIFTEIGFTGKYSIYDYLDFLSDIKHTSNRIHIFQNLLFLPAFALFFANTMAGIVTLVAVICFNIASYMKYKKEIEPYITSFSYVFRILNGAKKIETLKAPLIEDEKNEIHLLSGKFKKFYQNSSVVMKTADGSNPLDVIFIYFNMTFHMDIMIFNRMLHELMGHQEDIDRLITKIGYLETLLSIGCFRESIGTYCTPEICSEKILKLENVYHPYISDPVKNTIEASRGVLLTGSNASGKSTFLKTVALNAVLAQTIYTCAADSYKGCFFKVYSSMALRDDLGSKESYYIVEIRSLKRILDQAQDTQIPVLCFVDEVLRGTNTVERIAASSQILYNLADKNVICFAATHDIELTQLLKAKYDNYHFEEEITNDDVIFNYLLKTGHATTRNAIKLLSVMGYEESIIENANLMASGFLENGIWDIKE